MALPIRLSVLRALTRELSASAADRRTIAVAGPLADVLRKELVRGGDESAVRQTDDPRGAAVLVYVLGRGFGADDEGILKRARRARVPIVVVAESDEGRIPYVLATDIVPLPRGAGFPVDEIARTIARKLGENGTALAARLPVLRGPVCEHLVASFARKNAIVAAAIFVPGADLPVLMLNQLRLVLRIAAAHGRPVDAERLPEVVATVGAGFGLRTVARELLDVIPVAGWAVQSGVAYAGTRALGEAAIRRFAADAAGDGAARPGA